MAKKKSFPQDEEKIRAMTKEQIEAFLTPRERLFCMEYIKDSNGTDAAIRAELVSPDKRANAAVTASRMLSKPAVMAYKRLLLKELFGEMDIGLEQLVLSQWEIYCRCMQKTPVMEWDSQEKCYKPSGVWQFDAKGASKALEAIARMLDIRGGGRGEGVSFEQWLMAQVGQSGRREF